MHDCRRPATATEAERDGRVVAVRVRLIRRRTPRDCGRTQLAIGLARGPIVVSTLATEVVPTPHFEETASRDRA